MAVSTSYLLSTPCRTSARSWMTRRVLSTSSASVQVGPESPSFIEVPRPPQQRHVRPPRLKGFLPVPRTVSPPGAGNKVSPEYLDATAPFPKPDEEATDGKKSARVEWKERMAASRRRNLREGLGELYTRNQRSAAQLAAASAQRHAEREEILNRPLPDDERLTNPTVMRELLRLQGGRQPARKRAVKALRRKLGARQERKNQDRRAALHTLYMHARAFITNSDQLQEAIDKEFGTEDSPVKFGVRGQGMSIWNTGKPHTVQALLRKAGRVGESGAEGPASVTHKRVTKLAEELTGGKL